MRLQLKWPLKAAKQQRKLKMPYIVPQQRIDIHADLLENGLDWTPENAGELNFLVSNFISNYLNAKGLKYANINEMIGALECAKLELARAVINPYEQLKIEENGPVY
jgi:hypothetical protein